MKERCRDGCRTSLLIAGVVLVPAIFHTSLPPCHPYITIHFMEMIFSTCTVKANLRANAEAMSQLEETFKARYGSVAEQLSRDELEMTVCRLVAQRPVSKALQAQKQHAGFCFVF